MFRRVTLTTSFALLAAVGLSLAAPVLAQDITEAPSTVNATYVPESATEALAPGVKIEKLYTKNVTQDYILQRLTDRVYFFQSQFYGTVFYVGDEGVLLFDALEGRSAAIEKGAAARGKRRRQRARRTASATASWPLASPMH